LLGANAGPLLATQNELSKEYRVDGVYRRWNRYTKKCACDVFGTPKHGMLAHNILVTIGPIAESMKTVRSSVGGAGAYPCF
jgi:hypothetical protein